MRVPYGEGVATHTGPESCAGAGNLAREALTGESAGWVLSREIQSPREREVRGADAVKASGRPHWARRECEVRLDPARSKTPCMRRSASHGSREIPASSAAIWVADRIGNPEGASR